MKQISLLLIITVLTGCSTFRPIGSAHGEFHDRIVSKKSTLPGKQVKIVTTDGKHYKFRVVDVTDEYIEGKNVKVLVADIESFEIQKFSAAKTTCLILGIVAAWYILYGIAVVTAYGEIMRGPQ